MNKHLILSKTTITILVILFFCVTLCIIQSKQTYKVVTYGDSITAGFSWQPYLEEYYGVKILNLGIGGSCVTSDQNCPMTLDTKNEYITRYKNNTQKWHWQNFYRPIQRIITSFDFTALLQHDLVSDKFCSVERLNTIPKSSNIIFIMGGTNDVRTNSSLSEFEKCYEIMINFIETNRPNAQIIILSPIHNISEKDDYFYRQRFDSIRSIIKSVASKHHLHYINVTECGITPNNCNKYLDEGIHPNSSGGKIIADYIVKHLSKN